MILFFYGEEYFLIEQEVKKVKSVFLKDNQIDSLNVFDFDDETDLEKLTEGLAEQGLFSSKKMILIKNFFSNTKANEQNYFLEILQKNDFAEDLIVFSENGQPRKNAKLFKYLETKANKFKEFKKLEGKKILNWIQKKTEKLSSKKVCINERVAGELVVLTSGGLRQINSELNKLVNYTLEGEIKFDDLQILVNTKVEADIFQTIELAFQKNKQKALFLLKKQLARGDDPFYIFSMYVYQIRVLLRIAGCLANSNYNEFSIAKEVKLHPFVVKKSMPLVRKFSLKNLVKVHHFLLKLDEDIKLGKRDIKSALDYFVVKI